MGFETIIILIIAAIGSIGVALPRADGFGDQNQSEPVITHSQLSEDEPDSAVEDQDTEDGESQNDDQSDLADPASQSINATAGPTLDLMRFDGKTGVVSGQFTPNTKIIIRDGDQEIARTTTDSNGTFAMTFDYETDANGGILEVGALDASGAFIGADQALSVLPSNDGQETITASLSEDGVTVDAPKSDTLKLDSLSYGVNTPIEWQGHGIAGSVIEIIINGKSEASVTVGSDGKWSTQTPALADGNYVAEFVENGETIITHAFEVAPFEDGGSQPQSGVVASNDANNSNANASDQTDSSDGGADGSTQNANGSTQVSTPQAVVSPTTQSITIGNRVYQVQRGDSLWRIAERYFGDGEGYRYTEIFSVNASQINNPDLIFPEQELDIPEGQ